MTVKLRNETNLRESFVFEQVCNGNIKGFRSKIWTCQPTVSILSESVQEVISSNLYSNRNILFIYQLHIFQFFSRVKSAPT